MVPPARARAPEPCQASQDTLDLGVDLNEPAHSRPYTRSGASGPKFWSFDVGALWRVVSGPLTPDGVLAGPVYATTGTGMA